jgi:type VI secretion system protein ImpC
MTIKSSFGAVNLDVNPGAHPSATVLDPETPFRILLLGDFSGRAAQAAQSSTGWKPVEIDRDNFDEVLARVAPGCSGMRFQELDDFHPDRIYRQSKLFQALREVRRKLEEPATFAEAAAEIRAWTEEPAPLAATVRTAPPVEAQRPAPPDAASGGSLLDSIVDAAEPKAPSSATRRGGLQGFVERVVAPHTVPGENPELPRLRSLVDAEAVARMRAMLHHSTFQALEAAWRSVFRLVRAIETGSQLKLYLLDISKAELAADLGAADDLRESRVWRILVDDTVGTGGDAWSVVAGDYAFTRTVGDAQMLGRLARIMSFAGAPFLAEADPGNSAMETEEAARHWERLRQIPEACWIGLAMPRFLLRLPYGKKTDPVESFDFEEMPGAPSHQEYLWGNPAFACVQLLAEAFVNDGWEMRPGAYAEIDRLPVHIYEAEGGKHAKPCAEVLLTERDIDWILDQGYMALDSKRDRDVVRLVRFQSIAKPLARLSGRWG